VFEPGDVRDLIIKGQENGDPVAWEDLLEKATTRGVDASDVETALSAAKGEGLVLAPRLGIFKPM
jgi:hemolysin activation/secretion protein